MTPSIASKLQDIIQEALDSDADASSLTVEVGKIGGGQVLFNIRVTDKEATDILGEDDDGEDDEDLDEDEIAGVDISEDG